MYHQPSLPLPVLHGDRGPRRRSLFDVLKPSENKPRPRSNSFGVFETANLVSPYPSTPSPFTPFSAGQRTKCFAYPSFGSAAINFDSPTLVVSSNSPSVLQYGRMVKKITTNFNREIGPRLFVSLILFLFALGAIIYYKPIDIQDLRDFSFTRVTPPINSRMHYHLHPREEYSERMLGKPTFNLHGSPSSSYLASPLISESSRRNGMVRVLHTVVGQLRTSGFSEINLVAADKLLQSNPLKPNDLPLESMKRKPEFVETPFNDEPTSNDRGQSSYFVHMRRKDLNLEANDQYSPRNGRTDPNSHKPPPGVNPRIYDKRL